jgi:hypothetical protein
VHKNEAFSDQFLSLSSKRSLSYIFRSVLARETSLGVAVIDEILREVAFCCRSIWLHEDPALLFVACSANAGKVYEVE